MSCIPFTWFILSLATGLYSRTITSSRMNVFVCASEPTHVFWSGGICGSFSEALQSSVCYTFTPSVIVFHTDNRSIFQKSKYAHAHPDLLEQCKQQNNPKQFPTPPHLKQYAVSLSLSYFSLLLSVWFSLSLSHHVSMFESTTPSRQKLVCSRHGCWWYNVDVEPETYRFLRHVGLCSHTCTDIIVRHHVLYFGANRQHV